MAKYVAGGRFSHPRLGTVAVRLLGSARNITARWKSPDLLSVTVPPGLTAADFDSALDRMEPRLLAKRPQHRFFLPGWTYSTPEMDFEILLGTKNGVFEGRVDRRARRITLFYPPDCPAEGSHEFNRWVDRTLHRYARAHAAAYLLPRARQIAGLLGVHPSDLQISYGQRVLGRCNSRGQVLLSRNLVFYPLHLRDAVIAHEFAHLTHLDHSPRFHTLLDTYLATLHASYYPQPSHPSYNSYNSHTSYNSYNSYTSYNPSLPSPFPDVEVPPPQLLPSALSAALRSHRLPFL